MTDAEMASLLKSRGYVLVYDNGKLDIESLENFADDEGYYYKLEIDSWIAY